MYDYKPQRVPRVIGGVGAFQRISGCVDDTGSKRIFLVTSPRSAASPQFATLRALLSARLVGEFTHVEPHSPIHVIKTALAEAKKSGCDCLVSFGGGSVIDTAKGMIWYWDEKADNAPLRHIAVPSTFSGAEFGVAAGITVDGHKNVHRHPRIIVDAVVFDPSVIESMPLALLQGSWLNAIDHCLEGSVSIGRSPMTDASYLHAIRLLNAGSDFGSTSAFAALQAGAALASIQTVPMGLAHALAHVVGGRYRTPHGLTHGLVAGPVMRFNSSVVAAQQRYIAEAFGVQTAGEDDKWAARQAAEAVEKLVYRMGGVVGLRALDVPESGLRELAQMALNDRNCSTNPRPVGVDDVYMVLQNAWSGEPMQ